MYSIKKIIKKMLPSGMRYYIANAYHFVVAVAANIRYGFPARGAQVVMVTGTNGKTTTVAYIAEVLKAAGHNVGVVSTAFYQFGDETEINTTNRTVNDIFEFQKLLWRMKQAKCDFLVIEVTSMALVQHRVWGVPCDVAVMTNLTQDHLDYHKTMERYAAAKGKLFARSPRLIVLNQDDEWYEYFNRFEPGEKKVSYGANNAADCRITDVTLGVKGSKITCQLNGAVVLQCTTQLPGKFNVYNAVAAIATGYYLQLEPGDIVKGIESLKNVPGRMERIENKHRFEVIVDYAHTPDALQNVLETVRNLTKGKVWIVFGATGSRDTAKRPVMGEIAATLADRIIITDDEPYYEDPSAIRTAVMQGIIQAGGQAKTQEIADRRQAIITALTDARPRDTVIIAGMGHEQFRIVAGERQPWSDAQVAKEALQSRG